MHIYAQITHLSAQMLRHPDSVIIPSAGEQLEARLRDFQQWSDLSAGHSSSEQLLQSCVLNEEGEVTTAKEVTELIGESYVAAAQIYLHCRLFRKSRDHSDVQKPVERLMKCTLWPPLAGPLYTAQQPLYTVFIGGLVARSFEQRQIIDRFFQTTGSGNRSVSVIIRPRTKHVDCRFLRVREH